ncbi:hypothetical protein [Actinoplanes sp. NPDC049118]|uniref:hypothetical protein n=1 Tax=Actinoplanes sp. NPDC049118 TaxID=3155769 RepID=UPI0033D79263
MAFIAVWVHDDHMTPTVIHQPRVAWDGARAFVRIAQTPNYQAFADHVYHRLGPETFTQLEETHERLLDGLIRSGGDRYVMDVEAGKWRVRLEDLLRTRPNLADAVLDLTAMVPRT